MRRRTPWALALFLLASCATYQPRPLDRAAVEVGLQPPPPDSVSIAAAKLNNPLLPPLVFDPSDGVSPDEAAVLAVVANPELRAARARRGLARAELITAGVLPNPQLAASADVPVRDNTGATTGTGLGLSLDLNALFTRGAEMAAARANQQSVQLDLAWQEWQVAEQARLQTYRQLFLQRQRALAREEEDALRSNRDQLERAAAEHLVTDAERAAAVDAFRTARDTRLQLEGELESARQALARVLGQPPSVVVVLQTKGVPFLPPSGASATADTSDLALPGLTTLAATPDDSLVARLQRRRLDLVALRMGYESHEQSLRAAVQRSFPRINLGVNRLVDTSKVLTWGPALTLDLPFFDRNQGEIATGRATREQLYAEYLARVFAARADVADLRQQIQHVRRRLGNAEESLPELGHLVDVYGRAFKLGTVDALLYYDARTRKTNKELEVLRLRQNLAELTVGLETATGGLWTYPTAFEGDR
jgi:cobalt-zinc-cadmium efflux system outer membrane protein